MKPIAIDTFLQYQFLSSPLFSPDGAWIAFLVQQASLEKNGYHSDIYLYDLKNEKTRRLTQTGDVKHFAWLPQGTLLLARTDPQNPYGTAVSEISPETGKENPVCVLPVKVLQFHPQTDSRLVILAEYRVPGKAWEPGQEYDIFEELPFRWNAQGLVNGVRKRLYFCDLPSGALSPIAGEDFYVGNLSTSPWRLSVSRDKVLFIGQNMESGVQKQYPGLYCYDIPTGKTRCYIPDGQRKVEVAQLWEDGAVITTTDGSQYGSCQMPEFFLLNLETGEMEPLCLYQFSVGAAITTDSTLGSGITHKIAGDFLYFITLENGCSYLRRLDRNGILSDNLTPDGSCASFDIWKDHVTYLGMYGNGLRELYLDGKQITFFNDPLLQDYSISSPIPLESQRPGGETVQGWVIPPAGYQKGKKYPAILNIHGGPHAAFGAVFFHEMQVWANAGYFVFYCNPHGSDGRGNAFGDMRGIYGSIDYEDIMAFTDAVLAAWPDIDASRLGVTGGSYGGYMTNWIIGHTNRFRCAASQRSISDWAISEMASDCGYQRNAAKMGASALEDHEKVWFHSPLKYAGNVTTPTLFLHSYEDYRCHHIQAIAMYTAIRQRGVESRLCIFKGENHELSRSGKPTNRISRMQEILNWMDRHLKN